MIESEKGLSQFQLLNHVASSLVSSLKGIGGWWTAGPKGLLIFLVAALAVAGDEAVRASRIVIKRIVRAAYRIHFLGGGPSRGYASDTLGLRYLRGMAKSDKKVEEARVMVQALAIWSHGMRCCLSMTVE